MLSVSDLEFAYNGDPILEQISLDVAAGELLAILGPNGVGKTTLLKCLNRIHKAKSGTVLVEEANILELSSDEIATRIGYVPQRHESSRLSVFDSVLMGRRPHLRWGVGKKDLVCVQAALEHLELDHLGLRHLDQLSGGELQKVAIARALVQEPKLLLFDEPTSALDLKNQLNILTSIRRIVSEHKIAAVMTMHDLNSALRFADRYCFIKEGKIFAICDHDTITPEIISEVYGIKVTLHRLKGQLVVLPEDAPATAHHSRMAA